MAGCRAPYQQRARMQRRIVVSVGGGRVDDTGVEIMRMGA